MRAFLYASLVALGAATEYDDDDLNFLRMLQSNGSNATTVPATTVPATTVASSGNATTVPATTVASSSNATTVPATTVASGSSPPSSGTTTPPATNMCLAATYTNLGFADPGTLTQSTSGIMVSCADSPVTLDYSTAEKSFYNYGERAFTTANLAKCTNKVEQKCSESPTAIQLELFNTADLSTKAAMLHECCGVAPSPIPAPKAPAGTLYADPTFKMEMFSDSACATAATTAQITSWSPQWAISGAFGTNNEFTASGCADLSYAQMGLYTKFVTCNSTATPATGDYRHMVIEGHLRSTCSHTPFMSSLSQLDSCNSATSTGGANGTTLYKKETCSGGSAVTVMEIKTALAVVLSGLGSMTSTQKNTVLSTTCIKLKTETQTATGDATAVAVVESCSGTGALSAATYAARRVRRRLASHQATVNAVIRTQVSAAGAASAKSNLVTAAASGTLSSATLGASVVTALQAETSISSVVASVNATASVTVFEPTLPTTTGSTGGGSTAGAFAQGLSAVVGFLIMAVLFV